MNKFRSSTIRISFFYTLLVFLSLTFFTSDGFSQSLNKKEKKAIKKELRQYKKDPESYQKKQKKQKERTKELEEEVEMLSSRIAELSLENNNLEALVQELMDKLEEANEENLPDGTVYKVQMGYYQQLNLKSFNAQNRYIRAEEIDGAKRYSVGFFRTLEEAMQFANDVKKLGIQDAFVSQYIDGERNMSFDALKVKR